MGGKKSEETAVKPKDDADTSNTDIQQEQADSQVVGDVQTAGDAKTPVTDPHELTEGQVTEQGSSGKEEDTQANKTATSEAEPKEVKPKKPQVAKKTTEPSKQDETQAKKTEKNLFELKIHNKGRRRLLQFCGVFLEAGQATAVVLKNQQEVDHVKDTLRQFNELAGRDDLVIEETE